jgi:hypothetical protein
VVDEAADHPPQQGRRLAERVSLGEVRCHLPHPGGAGVARADPERLVQGVAVAALPAGLPPAEPQLPEPGEQVAPPPPLTGPGPRLEQAVLELPERLEQELPARLHQGGEDRPLERGERGVLGPGDPDGYAELGHVGVLLDLDIERTLRAPTCSVWDFRDWLRGDATATTCGFDRSGSPGVGIARRALRTRGLPR